METPEPHLTARERVAMLAVWDGFEPREMLCHYLHHLYLHMPEHLVIPGFELLQRNKLTGKKLADFIFGELQGDAVALQAWLIRQLFKDKSLRLIAGKTFRGLNA